MTPARPHSHSYDAPGLTPREFLFRVMRDKSAPLAARIDAAGKLLRLVDPAMFREPEFTIRLPPFTTPVLQ